MDTDYPASSHALARIGKDELNLCEFPFALLQNRPPKNARTSLECRDGGKEWIVRADPEYGLPTAPDIAVYVVLMEITREQRFPLQVQFSRYDLLRRLHWDTSGKSYERLTLALDRLVGVTIRTRNAFYDASQRRHVSKEAFHILERYKIEDVTLPGEQQPSAFPCWIRWSPELYANIAAGYIKSLDVNLFLSLKHPISQALYRYLDAKRGGDGKAMYRIAVRSLVFDHLGMSRTYYPSEAKHKLKPAHEELISVGFLSGVEYAPMKTGEEMVVYWFGSRPESGRNIAPAVTPATSPLAQRLIEAGLSRKTAQDLVTTDPGECEKQLEYLPYRDARDSGAVLVKAIREGWAPPPGWVQAQAKEKTAAAAQQKRAEEAAREQERAKAEADFDAWWSALPAEQREAITARAVAACRRENKTLAEMVSRSPRSPLLRPYLKKHSGWPGSPAASQQR